MMEQLMTDSLSRRGFARAIALGASVAWFPRQTNGTIAPTEPLPPLPRTPSEPDEKFWQEVRARFALDKDLSFLNAANLCPTSLAVLESVNRASTALEADPSPANLDSLGGARERSRLALAQYLQVSPEEIVITRNASEANNLIVTGLDFRPGDEVVVFEDNHPSNLDAWRQRAER